MIGAGLGGGVGRAGRVGRGFGEQVVRAFQVAIHLVSGDVVEAERGSCVIGEVIPVPAGGLEQRVRANHVGLDELGRAVDRAVHVGLGGEVHHRSRAECGEDLVQGRSVADIDLVKAVARRVGDRGKRFEIAGLGELVEVRDVVRRALYQVPNHGRADEASPAGNEDAMIHRKVRSVFFGYQRVSNSSYSLNTRSQVKRS